MSVYVPLEDAGDEARFGGKAAGLARALALGLPVPGGFAIEASALERLGSGASRAEIVGAHRAHGLEEVPIAMRSSAIGEDSAAASFAGQHLTRLHVLGAEAAADAALAVWCSGRSEAALAYRARVGVAGAPRIGAVVQAMLHVEVAGVLFTVDPLDGRDRRVVEASWGLGEAVVSGLVTPDRYTWARGKRVAVVAGEKDVMIRARAGGGTEEVPVEADRVHAPCLDEAALAALEDLAARVEAVLAGPHDIEWAMAGGRLYLLQRRAVTR